MQIDGLIWFLLPIAAAAGWYAAKRSMARRGEAFWKYSQQFHDELGQLLSAKDSSVQFLDSFSHGERDAVETHIALGNLYRRRGEIDRAIVIHENLIGKQDLDADMRAQARFELARDYDSAGLLDRSENAFQAVIASGQCMREAYEGLLHLHERQQDWQRAIEVALQCEQDTGDSLAHSLSHYHCELAVLAIKSDERSESRRLLSKALDHWPQCPRAYILLAQSALDACEYSEAIRLYDEVESLRPELIPEIIENRFDAYLGLGEMVQVEQFINRLQSQRNAYSVIRITREIIARLKDERTADRFFKDQILKRPSLKGLRDWAHDQLALSSPGERDKVKVICNLLDQVMEDKPAYRCHSCGFQGNVMHWRCPSCQSWDTVSTIIGVEGE